MENAEEFFKEKKIVEKFTYNTDHKLRYTNITGWMANKMPYECIFFNNDYKKNKVIKYGIEAGDIVKDAVIDYYKNGIKEYNENAKINMPKLIRVYNDFTKPIKINCNGNDMYLYPGYSSEIPEGSAVSLLEYPNDSRFDMIYRNKDGEVIKKEIIYFLVESDGVVKTVNVYSKSIEYYDGYRKIEVNSDGFKYNFNIEDKDRKNHIITISDYEFINESKSIPITTHTEISKKTYTGISVNLKQIRYKLFNPTNIYELVNLKDLYVIDAIYDNSRIERLIVK